MLDIMYEIPKDDNIGRVTITREYIQGTGGPVIEIRGNQFLEDKTPSLPEHTQEPGEQGVVFPDTECPDK